MRWQRRLWTRRLRNIWQVLRRHKCGASLAVGIFAILLLWFLWARSAVQKYAFAHCAPIDVVYTWVNGSDPAFIESARRYNPAYDPARFDDKNELRYSLRSLELHAPWVRHVYIVTNGQIPHWLDLSYERVTVVPHHVLVPQPAEVLPTFSSAAIETFLHRIPNLSQRFLYLNDDIFLGAPVAPEDLYTESEGVRIYQASWLVPDCAEDCPWTYIGDGACDRHCNIAECQYDGGDCSAVGGSKSDEGADQHFMVERDVAELVPEAKNQTLATIASTVRAEIRKFPMRKLRFRPYQQSRARNASSKNSFKELVRHHRNLSTLNELQRIVDSYNTRFKLQHNEAVPVGAATASSAATTTSTAAPRTAPRTASTDTYKSTKDIYSHSLIHTNMLLNRHYGFKARNVLAHVGFLLDRDIVDAMQVKLAIEVHNTATHRFRAADDLQFAFAYYFFLMGEVRAVSVQEIFDEFDTDFSGTWSDREVRTFLARMYPLPLDWSALRFFEEVVNNCSHRLSYDSRTESAFVYSTLVYERYEDSNMPTITRDLVVKCPLLAEALEANFAARSKYKYNLNSKRNAHSNFMMLTSNVTEVVDALDKLRRNPRKFNCINDNLEPQYVEDNELVRHLLEDFYLSFFPRRSKFELDAQYRNRFANWHEYQRWRRRKRAALVLGYSASIILILFLVRFLCVHKAKFVRRYVQRL